MELWPAQVGCEQRRLGGGKEFSEDSNVGRAAKEKKGFKGRKVRILKKQAKEVEETFPFDSDH